MKVQCRIKQPVTQRQRSGAIWKLTNHWRVQWRLIRRRALRESGIKAPKKATASHGKEQCCNSIATSGPFEGYRHASPALYQLDADSSPPVGDAKSKIRNTVQEF